MQKYAYIIILALIACTIAFVSCKRMEQMIAPVMDEPKGEVAAEIIINYLLAPPTMATVETPDKPMAEIKMDTNCLYML